MQEFGRFLSLYHQQALHTVDYLKLVAPAQWRAVPVHSDALFLGSRVKTITIAALTRHLMAAETHWIHALQQESAAIGLPQPDPAVEALADGEALVRAYQEGHARRMKNLEDFHHQDLDRELRFAGRRYTTMGFLWAIYSHHGYHLGQIDLLMRQLGTEAPEYMEWPETHGMIA